MALEEYVGAIVMEVDGQEIEVVDVGTTSTTGIRPVKTMNRSMRVKGFSRGIAEFSLRVTVVIPLTGDRDWEAIQGAKITLFPATQGGQRVSYLDCYTVDVGEQYNVDNEARRDLNMFAARKEVE